MGCNCGNKKKQDYDYIKKLANAWSVSMETDVQIFAFFIGGTKYFDFDELPTREKRSEIIETLRFRQHKSNVVLPAVEETRLNVIADKSTGKRKSVRKRTDIDKQ